ncbi:hypothetical protein [Pelagicoccus albus]|uniref:Uncharacterized protein n=1 Tax=Pelagicoccus albus TaxID=415222 RepID=A0A7X1B852_9BACT|nr:hypothetical protein [Pelagicoccus albus]MBC2607448.1 hypothetical protein [Pelagicoccus albus]
MTIKKHFCLLIASAVAFAGGLAASPLAQSEIDKDAKWLAHVDMEGLMNSSFSEMGVAKLKELIQENNESSISIDVDLLLSEIKSITAYGASFQDDAANESVIILKTGDRMQAIFDGFIAHQEMEGKETGLELLDDKPYQSYLLGGELFLAFPDKNYAIAGKNYDRIERAYRVVEGDGPSLESAKEPLILNEGAGFFLMFTANGIDSLKNMPPQARMLQKTKGGQLSIGEKDGLFRANVILTTSGREVSLQLYRIVQGMVALASFTQVENQSMVEVMNGVVVDQGDSFVSVDFSYPVDKLLSLIGSVMKEATENHSHGATPPTPPAPPTTSHRGESGDASRTLVVYTNV